MGKQSGRGGIAMYKFRTEFNWGIGELTIGHYPSAESPARFEYGDLHTCIVKFTRGGQTCHTSTDDEGSHTAPCFSRIILLD